MKRLILLPFLTFVILAVGLFWIFVNVQPASSNPDFKNFLIEKGSTASQIGDKLQNARLIKSSLAFKIYVRVTGTAGRIPTGEFRLSPSFTLFQTVDQLLKGPIEVWVTIPEGLRREEIATKFTAGLSRDQVFTNEFLQASKGQEGMLFPDTYLFPKDASASSVVNKMARTFDSKTSQLNLTKDQIILASLLERETKTDIERPIVAGILLKRLKAGWPLQVDASVQYAVGTSANWWPILTKDDINIKSPYNTYKYPGLPPTPIASPGLSSLKAAFSPVATDYWYYIHDTSGVIHYAKTLEEHNANIKMYLTRP